MVAPVLNASLRKFESDPEGGHGDRINACLAVAKIQQVSAGDIACEVYVKLEQQHKRLLWRRVRSRGRHGQ